ncbi:hypothetical protein [Actinoallomurus iriomotensis]|uniref:hypothetical protein n=1 Tax=Actinoallomurus iriomotensis TaxID=478107 RepID=UPI002553FF37|nr:hypothetical protein [Actinoallomurus iriomotensis]
MRSIRSPCQLESAVDVEELEQELVGQFSLAVAGASDRHVAVKRADVVESIRVTGQPVWTAAPEDADRYFVSLRRDRGLSRKTMVGGCRATHCANDSTPDGSRMH